MENTGIILFLLIIAATLGCRLIAGRWNRDRIWRYIAEKEGRVAKIVWDPLGPGWFGERSDAIYEVDYYDREGNHRRAHCKTSLFSGVYLCNEKLVFAARRDDRTPPKPLPDRPSPSLEEENRILKEENERLRKELERLLAIEKERTDDQNRFYNE